MEWKYEPKIINLLTPYEKDFVEAELGRSLNYYRTRIKGIGFSGLGNVLDVACGMGQWTIALALENNAVTGIDFSSMRLMVASHMANKMSIDNIKFGWADMHKLPFESNTFDGIFCYGALMFGNIPGVLKEFARVLKPKGRLFANINGYGWYIHLLLDRALPDKNIRLMINTLMMIARLFTGRKGNIPVSRRRYRMWLKSAGFGEIYLGPDAGYGKEIHGQQPIYSSTYYGLPAVIETLACLETV